jgi:hypothetical protein
MISKLQNIIGSLKKNIGTMLTMVLEIQRKCSMRQISPPHNMDQDLAPKVKKSSIINKKNTKTILGI